jgi:hypothetical protein
MKKPIAAGWRRWASITLGGGRVEGIAELNLAG